MLALLVTASPGGAHHRSGHAERPGTGGDGGADELPEPAEDILPGSELFDELVKRELAHTAPGVDISRILKRLKLTATVVAVLQWDEVWVHILEPTGSTDLDTLHAVLSSSLAQSLGVLEAEKDGVLIPDDTIPNDPSWSRQWGPRVVDGPLAWDRQRGSSAVSIAVLDTGLDPNQPDLKDAWHGWRDFVTGRAVPSDPHGHGTKSAGVAAARTDNRTGVAGMCWHCRIMPVRVMNDSGAATWSDVAQGITYATDGGAKVVSMSLSGSSRSSTLEQAAKYAYGRGVVLLGSAGNTGGTDVRYPAGYSQVIAVAGSTSSDARYNWSTHGQWVQVAAPGCNETTFPGTGFGQFCGTSSSTPLVAGIAGLLVSAGADRDAVWQALTSTGPGVSYVRHGRVDANAALTAVVGSGPPEAPEQEPETTTTTLKGALNNKNPSRAHEVSLPAGTATAGLTFSKVASLRLRVTAGGEVIHDAWIGSGALVQLGTRGAATYAFEVSSASGNSNYTLTVTHTTG